MWKENINTPVISVLIPVYNVEKYIERCLISLFENTIARYCEFIIVDDCSPDNSMNVIQSVLEKYTNIKENISLHSHDCNRGSAATRNTALLHSHGEYVICVDSDDWVEPDYLERLYVKANETHADIVVCDLYKEYIHKTIRIKNQLCEDAEECLKGLLTGQVEGWLWIKLIRRSLILENNISWVEGVDLWEDVLFSIKICYFASKIKYLSLPLYHYVQYNNNSICANFSEKRKNDLYNVTANVENFLKNKGIFGKLGNEFLHMKVRVMSIVIMSGKYRIKYDTELLYPEITSTILSVKSVPFYNRLCLFCLYKKYYALADLLKSLVILGRSFRNKLRG